MKVRNLLSLLLMGAMLLSSCGSEAAPDDTTAGPDGSDSTAPEETGPVSGVDAGVDLGGETYTMLNVPQYEAFLKLNNVMEETGDTLDDAVYRRNLNAMEKLNFKLEFNEEELLEPHTYIRTQVMANDVPFDFIITTQHKIVQLTTEELFLDLIDAPYIDITQPWWAEDYINSVNIGKEKHFYLAGDISLEFVRDLGAGFYNKTVYEKYHGDKDGLLDLVLEGKWTLDVLAETVREGWRDLNGDNEQDEDDAYGFRQIANIFTDHAFYDAGAHTCIMGEDGIPVLDPVSEKTVAIAEKIHALYHNNEGAYLIAEASEEQTERIMPEKFAADETMFYWGMLYYSDYLRDMKSDYGVIPYPKYEENDPYRALVHDGAPLACIPVTASGRFDNICAILEELAFQGNRLCTPAYFDIVLKGKYLRDTDKSAEVIDIIRDAAFTDVGYVYNYAINEVALMIRNMVQGDVPNITTIHAAIGTAAQAMFDALIETYGAIGE